MCRSVPSIRCYSLGRKVPSQSASRWVGWGKGERVGLHSPTAGAITRDGRRWRAHSTQQHVACTRRVNSVWHARYILRAPSLADGPHVGVRSVADGAMPTRVSRPATVSHTRGVIRFGHAAQQHYLLSLGLRGGGPLLRSAYLAATVGPKPCVPGAYVPGDHPRGPTNIRRLSRAHDLALAYETRPAASWM